MQNPVIKKEFTISRGGDYYFLIDTMRKSPVLKVGRFVGVLLLLCNGKNNIENITLTMAKYSRTNVRELKKKIMDTIESLRFFLEDASEQQTFITKSNWIEELSTIEENHLAFRKDHPVYIDFYLSSKCTRNCIYCFSGAQSKNTWHAIDNFLSVERFEKISYEAQKIGTKIFIFTGGEPMLNPYIFDYIHIAASSGISVKTSTKMKLNQAFTKKLLDAGLHSLQVSIDSSNNETEDFLVGTKGALPELVKTAENALYVGLPVSVKCVITKYNADEIGNLLMLLYDREIFNISFSFFGESCETKIGNLGASIDQVRHINSIIEEFHIIHPEMQIQYNFKYLDVLTEEKEKSKVKTREYLRRPICMASVNGMKVRSDGKVMFCDQVQYCGELIVGNLHTQGIQEVWESLELMRWLNPSKEGFQETPCYSCVDFERCYKHRCHKDTIIKYGTPFAKNVCCNRENKVERW